MFFNRDFTKDEVIGLYCGVLQHKATLADTGYNIDYARNKNYVIDAKGGIGYPIYFGWHFANQAPEKKLANVTIDADLLVFPTRDVKKGEEAFFVYGDRFNNINNVKKPQSKKRRKM